MCLFQGFEAWPHDVVNVINIEELLTRWISHNASNGVHRFVETVGAASTNLFEQKFLEVIFLFDKSV